MKELYFMILVVAGICLAVIVSFTIFHSIEKSLETQPAAEVVDGTKLRKEQERRTRSLEEQRKLYMEDYQQKVRDGMRKFERQ